MQITIYQGVNCNMPYHCSFSLCVVLKILYSPPNSFKFGLHVRLSSQILNFPMTVETTSFHRAGNAIETMDTISQAPLLPVKIYLDK